MPDRVHKGRGFPWTADQDAFLIHHVGWLNADLIEPISALGAPRTFSGIKNRREYLRLPPGPAAGPRGGDYFRAALRSHEDWPPMRGDHRKRDRLFQEALWTAQLDLVRQQAAS